MKTKIERAKASRNLKADYRVLRHAAMKRGYSRSKFLKVWEGWLSAVNDAEGGNHGKKQKKA